MIVESSLPSSFKPALAPAAILLAALLALVAGPQLPPTLSGLKTLAPNVLLLLGAAVAYWFNRGRAFIALSSLLLAYAGYELALGSGTPFAARAVYTALAVLVPANILLTLAFPERGVNHFHNYRWLLLGVAEAMLVAWIAAAGNSAISGTAWHGLLDHALLRSPPTPWLGRIVLAAALITAVARAWPKPGESAKALDAGMAGSLIALFIACEWSRSPGVFGAFMAASGAILLVAVLQESHRMAFRDELTGLPGRRALQERMAGLGPAYAIAMADVDHFKNFNDTHGHDVGDQVLKLVAARLAKIEGGAVAFRHGGEEFAVLFPDAGIKEALPHLEAIRASIENYRMAVRGEDRPADKEQGSRSRGERAADETLSVTVSMGVAGPGEKFATPGAVLKAADEALYRAKKGGRNRVSL